MVVVDAGIAVAIISEVAKISVTTVVSIEFSEEDVETAYVVNAETLLSV